MRPTADSYVRDGSSYANLNYGTASTLQVKNATANANPTATATGYSRQALLGFDLDVTSAVAAAVPSAGDGTAALAIWQPLGVVGPATVLNSRESAASPPVLEIVAH